MTGLIVLGVIVLIVVGIMLIPIGADLRYEGGELCASAKVCGILIQLLPKKKGDGEPKEKKEKKPKRIKKKKLKPEKPEGEPAKPKKKLSFTMDEILSLVKKVLKSFGRFGRSFKVDRFLLNYTAAGSDPYDTAVNYGYVNAALSALAPICRKRFKVRDCHVSTQVDFTADKMSVDFGLALSIRIGQIFRLVFAILFGALGILIKNKIRRSKEKKQAKNNAENGGGSEPAGEIEENKENIQIDERMNANG